MMMCDRKKERAENVQSCSLTKAPTEAADTNRSNHVVDTSSSKAIVANATETTARRKPQTQSGSALEKSSRGVSRGLPVVAGAGAIAAAGDRAIVVVWSTAVGGRAAMAVGWFNVVGPGCG